jgi:hypothetical protein
MVSAPLSADFLGMPDSSGIPFFVYKLNILFSKDFSHHRIREGYLKFPVIYLNHLVG